MSKYFINGKSIYSEKPLGDDEIGELGKGSEQTDTKPAEEGNSFTDKIKKRTSEAIDSFSVAHPTITSAAKKLISGPAGTPDEQRQRYLEQASKLGGPQAVQNILDKEKKYGFKAGQVIGTPESEGSVLPEMKHPDDESTLGYLGRGAYNQLIRPLGSPSGVLSMMRPGGISATASHAAELAAIDKGLLIDPRGVAIPPNTFHGPNTAPGKLALPPAPPEIVAAEANKPTFIASEKGVVPAGKPLSNPLARGAAQIETDRPGVPKDILTPSKAKTLLEDPLTPSQAKALPDTTPSGKIVDITDPLTKDLHAKAVANQESIPGPIRDPHEPSYPAETTPIVEQPSTKVKLKDKTVPEEKPVVLDNKGNVKTEPITPDLSPKEAVSRWANGRRGAAVRADFIKQDFKDLSDPSLIDAYEHGDRSGRLADVQKYFDDRHAEGVKLGLLKEDQKILNYIRHEFANTSDEVEAASKSYFAKNPSIAKTRTFPTYKAAEEAVDANNVNLGLKRKYQTLPEIMEVYEKKFGEAVRNKEMYDYLKTTGQISSKTMLSTRPDSWTFKGANADELRSLVTNVFSESAPGLKKAADIASFTKNLYLSGGGPGTKYNMHTWNLTRSDAKLVGFKKATQELLSDPTGKNAEAVFAQHADLLPELVDHGYTYRPIEDSGKAVNFGSKALDRYQSVFEKPLFEKALPALKLKRTAQVFEDLMSSGMDRKTALTKAADIGNTFYGGINKELRWQPYNDMSRIAFLAPDWLESRVRLALGDIKGVAKTILGKGDAVDKIHAKSFARGAAVTGTTMAAGAYGGNKLLKDNPSDAITLPMGKDSLGKDRQIPTIGTADEAQRLPIDVALKAYHGNPGGLIDDLIKNKLSQPFKSGINLARGQDDFGGSIRGKDKYGKDITAGRSIWLHIKQAAAPFQPQLLQYALRYAMGDSSLEEAVSGGFELPVKYSNPPKKDKLTLGSVGSVGSPY